MEWEGNEAYKHYVGNQTRRLTRKSLLKTPMYSFTHNANCNVEKFYMNINNAKGKMTKGMIPIVLKSVGFWMNPNYCPY